MTPAVLDGGAEFSLCEQFRYRLWRRWQAPVPTRTLLFIMLNPSTADAETNDPTVARCHRRAMREGYGRVEVVNLFAFRSTDPSVLKTRTRDKVGPSNDLAIVAAANAATTVVCAWGTHGRLGGRDRDVCRLLAGIRLHCLGVNKGGTPKHPLYISDKSPLVPFTWTAAAQPEGK